MDQALPDMVEDLPPEMVRALLRLDDVPRSFYPGMWLRRADEGKPWRVPTAEVIRVGRKHVHVLSAGCSAPVKMTLDDAREAYRKVYETPTPDGVAGWLRAGAEFTFFTWGAMKIRHVRWAYASFETLSGVLIFGTLEGLTKNGQPRLSVWDRLRETP